jgi:arylsulfatase
VQGKSLLDVLDGESFDRGPIFFEHEAHRAVIEGNWKLVALGRRNAPYEGLWELYDLSADRTETNNLVDANPEKAENLRILWENWASENNVYPLNGMGWNEKIAADVTKQSNMN